MFMSFDEMGDYISTSDAMVREVIGRMNGVKECIQLVIDEDFRLIGVVTDGDVRRALLRGIGMEDEITKAACLTPVTGRIDKIDQVRRAWRNEHSHIPFIPLIDRHGIIKGVLLQPPPKSLIHSAVIMAGGYGKRLGEYTREIPKPLIEVGGKPILEHVLRRLEDAGILSIYVCVHYMSNMIEEYIEKRHNKANIIPINEETQLGTAGGLANLPEHERRLDGEPLLVLNGDLITNVEIIQMGAFHEEQGHNVTVGAATYEHRIPYGVIHCSDDGRFLKVEEKPLIQHFVSAGIYILDKQVMPLLPSKRSMDMPELLNRARRAGMQIGLFPIHEFWSDIGRPDDLYATNKNQHLWDT